MARSEATRQSVSPVPKAPLCKGSCHGFAVTEGLSKVAGYFGDDLCRDSRPFLRTRAADAPLCAATQGNRGGSPQPPVGHDDPACRPSSPAGHRGGGHPSGTSARCCALPVLHP